MTEPQGSWPPPGGQGRGSPPGDGTRYPPPGGGTYYPPPSGGPYGSGNGGPYAPPGNGTWYYPPGTRPNGQPTNGGPQGPARRPATGVLGSTRRWVWALAVVALVLLLSSAHRISTGEIILFCVIVPSIILHEVAHGWVALAFGDDTAKRAGRLSLNPLRHVDLVGTLIVPAFLILAGVGWFGWAKPVPVNVSRLRNPRNQGVLVSLAGPLTNIALAVGAAVVCRATGGVAALEQFNPPIWALALFYLGLVNVWLAAFNLIPLPPLDGSVVIERALPAAWWPGYLRLRRYAMPILLGAVILGMYIHVGNTSLLGHLSNTTVSWWLRMLGVG